jgi:phage terminase small subunit
MANKLSKKQELFVEYYIQTKNATQAARLAGYGGSYKTLRSIGSQNLTKINIKEAISERFKDVAMETDEVLARLTSLARGFDPTKYMKIEPFYRADKKGDKYLAGYSLEYDLEKISNDGFANLIKRIYPGKYGPIVEWHDSKAALVEIAKAQGLFPQKFEFEGELRGPNVPKMVEALQEVDKELKRKRE